MISGITISNFKLYNKACAFDGLKQVNVLTGTNGRGKSTLLQSLLLPKQSLLESQWNDKLVLNGQYLSLGNAVDVRNDSNSRSIPVCFEYRSEAGSISLEFMADSDTAQKLPLLKVNGKPLTNGLRVCNFLMDSDNGSLSTLLSGITYVAAERRGPKLNYEPAPEHGRMDALGEYAPCLLFQHKGDSVEENALDGITDIFPDVNADEVPDRSLGGIVNFWLSRMFGETDVQARYVEEANVYVLLISTELKAKASKPTNVGFGYSYVLPILIAGMTCSAGETLIVENPEAHLHPMAQSILGKFMTWISYYRGVQIFVETHSEHIVNSFRVQVAQNVLPASELNILFFDERFEKYAKRINVDEYGRINEWPERFFDQEEKDLDIIL